MYQVDIILHVLGEVDVLDSAFLSIHVLAVVLIEQVDESHTLVACYDSQILVFRVEEASFSDTHGIEVLAHGESLGIIYIAGSVCCENCHLLAVAREGNVLEICLERKGSAHGFILQVDDLKLILGAGDEEESVRACIEAGSWFVDGETLHLASLAGFKDVDFGIRSHHVEELGVW